MVFEILKKQFIEVIDWPSQDNNLIAWKFPVADNEIKNGAQLTVREGQLAVFLNEGQIADIFKPGRHVLSTQNLPILTTLGAWKQGFQSPFKADVVFLSVREFRDQKWGTAQPVVVRDDDFGIVRVRAFGQYGLRIIDAKHFIRECAGVRDSYDRSELEETIRPVVVSRFSEALATLKPSVVDIAMRYEEIGKAITEKIARSFDSFGIELTNFTIESVNLPEDIQSALDEQSKMNLLMKDSGKFGKYQVLQSIPNAMGNGVSGLASSIAVGGALSGVVKGALDGTDSKSAGTTSASGEIKYCSECGTKNPRAGKFCQDCGHKFNDV